MSQRVNYLILLFQPTEINEHKTMREYSVITIITYYSKTRICCRLQINGIELFVTLTFRKQTDDIYLEPILPLSRVKLFRILQNRRFLLGDKVTILILGNIGEI